MKQLIPCIGHLSPEELIDASGLHLDDFDNKRIVDVGSGAPLMLQRLLATTNAQKLVGIDPVYKDPKSYAGAVRSTRRYIEGLLGTPDIADSTIALLKQRLQSIDEFSGLDGPVELYPDISGVGREKFDYVFVSFVFRHVSDIITQRLIEQIEFLRAKDGQIFIADGNIELQEVKGLIGKGRIQHYAGAVSTLHI